MVGYILSNKREVGHLDSFSGTSHVHGIGQVCPGNTRVGGFNFQYLIKGEEGWKGWYERVL